MRVLYAIANYPQLSETYVTAEIAFMLRQGVDVRVWSPVERIEGIPDQCAVYRGTLLEAVDQMKPDLIHVHYLMFARRYDQMLQGLDIPMTVRGHSFDFSPAGVIDALQLPRVQRVYLFPHFARQVPFHKKLVALPVAFDSTRFQPHMAKDAMKDPMMVLRLAAGRPGKGLGDFFTVSSICPGYKFVMALASCDDDSHFGDRLANSFPKGRVSLFKDVSWDTAEQLTRRAAIYLDTSDPRVQPFGMPISIAEALATGSMVLIRDSMAAREYAGDAAFYYSTPEEAAETINLSVAWPSDVKARQRERAAQQGALYADSVVLPRMLDDWDKITGSRR